MLGPYTWFFFSFSAAVVWGISYAMSEKLMKTGGLPPIFIMAFSGILYAVMCGGIALWTGHLKSGMSTISQDSSLFYKLALMAFLHVLGAGLIYHAISMKNATVVSLIEISYPVFVCLFAYILYRDIQVNMWTALGGLLIFCGVFTIYLKA